MTTYATSERTRTALIDSAGELFTRYGIDAVSTRAIAERAGENIGSIHYHFGGKKGLLQAALDVFFESWEDEPLHRVWDKHRDSLNSPHAREIFLEELVQTFFDRIYFAGRPWWCAGLLYQLFTYENDLSDQFIERHVRPHHELLQEVAKHLHPEFDDEQAFVWSQLLVGPIISLTLMRPMLQSVRGCSVEDPYPQELLLEMRRQIIGPVVRLAREPAERNASTAVQ